MLCTTDNVCLEHKKTYKKKIHRSKNGKYKCCHKCRAIKLKIKKKKMLFCSIFFKHSGGKIANRINSTWHKSQCIYNARMVDSWYYNILSYNSVYHTPYV